MTSAPGRDASVGPESEALRPADAGADDEIIGRGDAGVDEDAVVLRQTDRTDAAVLHARLADRAVHRQERGLADVEELLHPLVDVGPRIGEDEAGGDPLLTAAGTGDEDAVRRGLRPQARGFEECRGVGDLRIDREDLDLTRDGGQGRGGGGGHELGRGGGGTDIELGAQTRPRGRTSGHGQQSRRHR